jgi:hypothetical protein
MISCRAPLCCTHLLLLLLLPCPPLQHQRVETVPGLHTFARNKRAVGRAALSPLLEWARAVVPPRARRATPLFLFGTGGLRRLPEGERSALLAEVQRLLRRSGFRFEPAWARVLSGPEEAVYGWVALNYDAGRLVAAHELHNNSSGGSSGSGGSGSEHGSGRSPSNPSSPSGDSDRGPSSHGGHSSHANSSSSSGASVAEKVEDANTLVAPRTLGALDLGGSSLEVAFELPGPPPRGPDAPAWAHGAVSVTLAGVTHWLHTHAFHSYGLNEAFDRSVSLLLAGPASGDEVGEADASPEELRSQEDGDELQTPAAEGRKAPGNGVPGEKEDVEEERVQQEVPTPAPPTRRRPTPQAPAHARPSNEGSQLVANQASSTPRPSELGHVEAAGLSPAEARAAAAGLRRQHSSGDGSSSEAPLRAQPPFPGRAPLSLQATQSAASATAEWGNDEAAWRDAALKLAEDGTALDGRTPNGRRRRWQKRRLRRRLAGTRSTAEAAPAQPAEGGYTSPGDADTPPVVHHPCLHDGYAAPYTRIMFNGTAPDPPAVRLVGAQDFDACMALGKRLVRSGRASAGPGCGVERAPPGSACVLGSLQPQLLGSFTALTGEGLVRDGPCGGWSRLGPLNHSPGHVRLPATAGLIPVTALLEAC